MPATTNPRLSTHTPMGAPRWQQLAGDFEFSCYGCGKRSTEGAADLNGPAYRAYYCVTCYRKAVAP